MTSGGTSERSAPGCAVQRAIGAREPGGCWESPRHAALHDAAVTTLRAVVMQPPEAALGTARGHAPGPPVRVLVVDDEAPIREFVETALRYEGFDVACAATGREALRAAESFDPALIVLDVMLPDHDGFEVTRRLRRHGLAMPVVFLTARDATADAVAGLALGGDDYITKPFSIEELVARVRAVLRRTAAGPQAQRRLVFADLELDDDAHEVRRGGTLVELTATEYKLLHCFLRNPRRVLSKGQLLEQVWDYAAEGDAGVVETYVSYLRRKLDGAGSGPSLLHTVRGSGYVLRAPGP